jgi:hypothetical protein
MEWASLPTHDRRNLDARENGPSYATAIGELREAGAAWKELSSAWPQRREDTAVAEKYEAQLVVAELFGHVAAVDEKQLERASCSGVVDCERASIEVSDDLPRNVKHDDDSDT